MVSDTIVMYWAFLLWAIKLADFKIYIWISTWNLYFLTFETCLSLQMKSTKKIPQISYDATVNIVMIICILYLLTFWIKGSADLRKLVSNEMRLFHTMRKLL